MNATITLRLLVAWLLVSPVFGDIGDWKLPPSDYECRWTEVPITIDGKADESSWSHAELIDNFYLPWKQENARPALTATKAKLLWDRDAIYFFAEMEDTDIYADVTEHDGKTWDNDVFELFLKPSEDAPGYYEFQVNAAGTVMDMMIPRRRAGGFNRFVKDGEFHIETKVTRNGTLNKWYDTDKGWTVEGRIPWTDFIRTGGRPTIAETWRFALCRYDYSVDLENTELSTCAPLKSKRFPDFHAYEDYASLKFVGPKLKSSVKPYGIRKHKPLTTSRVKGSPEPPSPYRVDRAYPKWDIQFPVFAIEEPGSSRIIFISQPRAYRPTQIFRTTDDPASGEVELLIDATGGTDYCIAFHPNFKENGYVYIGGNHRYDGPDTEHKTRITRYTIDRKPPFGLDLDSAKVIIEWESNGHNGGAIVFGKDGMLYVTSGDGTSDSDVNNTGQDSSKLLAKVLRIDVDNPREEEGIAYSVPSDNPFIDVDGVRPETWATGMRNPWRIAADQVTGQIWVGNNGQDLWEQVYLIEKAGNYGWSVYEGSHMFRPNRKLGVGILKKPTAEHSHSVSRSLTGGIVYRGDKLPQLDGAYIYGDHSTGKVWGIKHDGDKVVWHKELVDTPFNITGFMQNAQGDLFILDHRGGWMGPGGLHQLTARPKDELRDEFPTKLSQTGLFFSVKDHKVADGMIPYSVNVPAWHDGVHLERYVGLPGEDAKINFRLNRGWSLPNDSVVIQTLSALSSSGDGTPGRRLETRLMVRQQNEWAGYSYIWNDDQTEAVLAPSEGATIEHTVTHGTVRSEQTWKVPSRAECMMCHSRASGFLLGLSLLQFNRDHNYGGVVDSQLRVFEHLGLLNVNWGGEATNAIKAGVDKDTMTDDEVEDYIREQTATRLQRDTPKSSLLFKAPEEYPALAQLSDATKSVDERARSYLHANCAICHVGAGGGNSALNFDFNTAEDKRLYVDEKPLHDAFGINDPRIVAPGDPSRSVLLHRIIRRGEGQMPKLGSDVPHAEAIDVIVKWITQMPMPQKEQADDESN